MHRSRKISVGKFLTKQTTSPGDSGGFLLRLENGRKGDDIKMSPIKLEKLQNKIETQGKTGAVLPIRKYRVK